MINDYFDETHNMERWTTDIYTSTDLASITCALASSAIWAVCIRKCSEAILEDGPMYMGWIMKLWEIEQQQRKDGRAKFIHWVILDGKIASQGKIIWLHCRSPITIHYSSTINWTATSTVHKAQKDLPIGACSTESKLPMVWWFCKLLYHIIYPGSVGHWWKVLPGCIQNGTQIHR